MSENKDDKKVVTQSSPPPPPPKGPEPRYIFGNVFEKPVKVEKKRK